MKPIRNSAKATDNDQVGVEWIDIQIVRDWMKSGFIQKH